mgnify:FL=1
MQTVTEVLNAATDSVNLINSIKDGTHLLIDRTQSELNDIVQKNVDHLNIILAYTEPDVVGSSADKTSYTTAITTGNTYIRENS